MNGHFAPVGTSLGQQAKPNNLLKSIFSACGGEEYFMVLTFMLAVF
jgi:hypothetical protein